MWRFESKRSKTLTRLRQQFGSKPENTKTNFEDISLYYELTKGNLSSQIIDDVTWNDLEMNRIFDRMNQTNCYIGEQVLYSQLHISDNMDKKEELEKLIKFMAENEEERLELQYAMLSIGKSHENYLLPLFLFNAADLSISNVWIYRILQFLLFGSFLAGVALKSNICFGVMVCTALLNLLIYAVNKVKYESYLDSLLSTKYMVSFAKMLSSKGKYKEHLGADKLKTAVKELNKLTYLIGNFQAKKSFMWTGDALDILRDYSIGLTLWDFTVFKKITNIIYGKLDHLLEIYEFIGRIDMVISIASFRKSLPFYCLPEFNLKMELNMSQVYHPLIDQPVSNELQLKDSCIITGSNASGKSTFIKAVAVNVILAQSINTCMAQSFRLSVMNVMTSMTVRDDIMAGESFYIKELKYLKRIVDEADAKIVSLCIIDEILRGTNTQERLASSEAVLKYLADRNCMVIVATHDMELAKALYGQYRCLNFCNYIEDGAIVFDYKIHEGYSQTQNAIKLLHHMGFPDSMIKMAEELNQKSVLRDKAVCLDR